MSDNSSHVFLYKLQNILFELDVTVGHSEQFKVLLKYKTYLEKMGNELWKENDWRHLGVLLKTLGDFSSNALGMAGGIRPKNILCAALIKEESDIQADCFDLNYKRAENVYQHVKTQKKISPYLNRHRLLEWAISLLMPFMAGGQITLGQEKLQKGSKLIAKAYLLRARFSLIKGQRIPAKKMEAIQKAWEWAFEFEKDDTPDDLLLLEIALARKKYLPDADHAWLKKYLNCLAKARPSFGKLTPHQLAGLDSGREEGLLDKEIDEMILGIPSTDEPISAFLPLIQARAAFRSRDKNLKKRLIKAVKKLENRWLSDPLWDDTVALIQQVVDQGEDVWKTSAQKAFEYCEKITRKLAITLQVRWYWARQASLYDLAFHAYSPTDSHILKVVDSLKSRPVLKMNQAEKYLKDKDKDNLKKIWEKETNALSDGYQAGLSDLHTARVRPDDAPTWQPVPEGYTAIHFYLSGRTDTGHMILIPPKGGAQQAFRFKLSRVLEVFEIWQNDLENCGKDVEKTNQSLLSACDVFGEIMKEGLSTLGTPGIIFIPHGFLHLAPLHAALVNKRPLFEHKTCLFLPAWWIYDPDHRAPDGTGRKVLLANWEDGPELDETAKDPRWSVTKEDCSPEDYVKMVNEELPIDFLAFYCHGKRHYSNPYLSALQLKNRDLTHQDLIHHTPRDAFKGARVMISACESDMSGGLRGIVDEHLSISSAFLIKGARQVCGSLYRGMSDFGNALIEECLGSDQVGFCGKVHAVQQRFIKGDDKLNNLYKSAAYRVVGLPDDA